MPRSPELTASPADESRVAARAPSNARRAVLAMASQGVVAGSSLVLQWLAFRELGTAGLGRFAILSTGIVVTVTALFTGWVGDSLVLLDRFEPRTRHALFRIAAVVCTLGFVLGGAAARWLAGVSTPTAVMFGAVVFMWLLEETGRRTLMARFEFGLLVLNDIAYAIGSLGLAGALAMLGRLTMTGLVASMLAGATLATAASFVQLPRHEWTPGPPAPPAYREVAALAGWRSGQLVMRPASMLAVRFAIARIVSPSALGLLEAGRLLIAPVMTAANGFGGFTLPFFSRKRQSRELDLKLVARLAAASAVVAAFYTPLAFLLAPVLGESGDGQVVSRSLIVAWCVYAVAHAANIPTVNAMVALHHSRTVFWGRVIDSMIIVGLSIAVVTTRGIEQVPVMMSIGMAIGTAIPVAILVRNGELAAPRITGARAPSSQSWQPVSLTGRFSPAIAAGMMLAMIVATDYDWRLRDVSGSLGGSLDVAVLIEVAVYGIVAAYLILFIVGPPRPRRSTAVQFYLWTWVIWTALSVAWAPFKPLAGVRAAQLVTIALVATAVAIRGSRRHLSTIVHGYLVLITVSAPVGLVWRVSFSQLQVGRYNWMAVHPVLAGAMLALALVIAAAYGLERGDTALGARRWSRSWYGCVAAVTTLALIGTQTRGSLAAAAIGLVVVASMNAKPVDRVPFAVLGSLSLVAAGLLFLDTVTKFLSRGESAESIRNLNSRLPLWERAWELTVAHPVTGSGFNAARGLFYEEIGLGGAHNAPINVMVETGFVGLTLWLGLLVSIGAGIARLRRSGHPDNVVMAGILATMIGNSMSTEGLGAGAGVSTILLLTLAAWVGVGQRDLATARRQRVLRGPTSPRLPLAVLTSPS